MKIRNRIKKNTVAKLSLLLLCVLAVLLPVAIVLCNPTFVGATDGTATPPQDFVYNDNEPASEVEAAIITYYHDNFFPLNPGAIASKPMNDCSAYIKASESTIATYSDEQILRCLMAWEKCRASNGMGTGNNTYKTAQTVLKNHYRDDYLSGSFTSGVHTFNIGDKPGCDYKGIHTSGLTLNGGTVNLIIHSTAIVYGRINISKGTLNITLADDFDANTDAMVRGAEITLADLDGFIANGATDGISTQFSSSIFDVYGGTLDISGSEGKMFKISGSGRFDYNESIEESLPEGVRSPAIFPADRTEDNPNEYFIEASRSIFYIQHTAANGDLNVNLDYVEAHSNYNASANGGAIYINSRSGDNPNVTLSNSVFRNCFAKNSGGFMMLTTNTAGSLVMENCLIRDCVTASVDDTTGGTLRTYGSNKCNTTIINTEFSNNWSYREAGGIAWGSLDNTQPLIIRDSNFEDNICYNGYGAIACSGSMTLEGKTIIDGNKSVLASGGGVGLRTWGSAGSAPSFKITRDSSIVLGSQVQIINNSAGDNGGGIYVSTDIVSTTEPEGKKYYSEKADGTPYRMSVYIYGATISGNVAGTEGNEGSGGGIFISKSARDFGAAGNNLGYEVNVYLYGGEITNNVSESRGGGIYINDANGGKGTVASFNMYGGTVSGNSTRNDDTTDVGGGAYIQGGGNFTMTGGVLTGNTAYDGGGVAISSGKVIIKEPTQDIIDELTYYGFEAVAPLITRNTALNCGGGAYVSKGNFDMYCGTISYNDAAESGGGAYVYNGTFTMHNGSITENDARSTTYGGGGVFVNEGNFVMNNGTISDNTAFYQGGGVYVNKGSFEMVDGVVTGNETEDSSGGAIRVSGGSFTINGGSIYGNYARMFGGAGYVTGSKGEFKMNGGRIYENEAYSHGGAICSQNGASATVSGGEIYSNSCGGNGGAIMVLGGKFTMTSGTMRENEALTGAGGAVAVKDDGGSPAYCNIGVEDCYGNGVGNHKAEDCPIIELNEARAGGAVAVMNASPEIYCCDISYNNSSGDGGAIYVENGDISVQYAYIVHNTATAQGGGIAVKASSGNVLVDLYSGIIQYNTAPSGAGISVDASGGSKATITIGKESCDGAVNSEHSHPNISHNIAQIEGGGLCFTSDSNNGIIFTMWCGYIGDNTANEKRPTGNIIQEGGTTTIYGKYAIENATVSNGSYIRPDLGDKTVTIYYHYDENDDKVTTVTVAYSINGNNMFVNLPSADDKEGPNQQRISLVRWEVKDQSGDVVASAACGEKLYINENTVGDQEVLHFYAVWLTQGQGYAVNPIIASGTHYQPMNSGPMYIYASVNNPFTVQYEVTDCNPTDFANRYLTLSTYLPKGTTVLMIDVNKAGVNSYYFYNVVGNELVIQLEQFSKMGTPALGWENSQADDPSARSKENFLFIFDFSRIETAFDSALQITMTREFANDDPENQKAPLIQVVSYVADDGTLPTISHEGASVTVGNGAQISYKPGIAENGESIYNGKSLSLIIRASGQGAVLPSESYVIYQGIKYFTDYDFTNGEYVIIVPVGSAAVTQTMFNVIFESKSVLENQGTITLDFALAVTEDNMRPMASPIVSNCTVEFTAKANPSAEISMDDRLFYTDSLADATVNLSVQNTEGYNVKLSILKIVDGNYTLLDSESGEVKIVCNDSLVTGSLLQTTATLLLTGASPGTYRILLEVYNDASSTLISVPYNFIILER